MKSLHSEKATLSERMKRLEKQNRRLKTCMALLSISFLALVLMGAKAGIT